MSENPEHHNHFIDQLAELVGQENSRKAIALADKARAHTAALLRAATEAVDPAPDQRALVTEQHGKIVELEAALATANTQAADLQAKVDSRDSEIAQLNGVIDGLKEDLAAATAPPPAPEPEPAVEAKKASAPKGKAAVQPSGD